jgi:hypothetical protein
MTSSSSRRGASLKVEMARRVETFPPKPGLASQTQGIAMVNQQELEEILAFDPTKPSKSFKQLLAENPHQKGGLAQLAAAEWDAMLRCEVAKESPSSSDTSAANR